MSYQCSRCEKKITANNKSGMCINCVNTQAETERHDMLREYLRGDLFREIGARRNMSRHTVAWAIYKHFPGVKRATQESVVDRIIDIAAKLCDVSYGEVIGSMRSNRFMRARMAVSLVASERGCPFSLIGKVMGKRDHSTIINATEKAKVAIRRDPQFAFIVNELSRLLNTDCVVDDIMSAVPPQRPRPEKRKAKPEKKGRRMNEEEWDDYNSANHRIAMQKGSMKLKAAIERALAA